MYVCACVYVRVYVCMYGVCVCVYVCLCLCVWVCVCVYVCMCGVCAFTTLWIQSGVTEAHSDRLVLISTT